MGDEKDTLGFGGTISSGSLGLRTGSCGSLQQNLQSSVIMSNQTTPIGGRKSSKLLSGSREKEKFLPRIFRGSSKRQLAMLYLLPLSVTLFFILMLSFSKGRLCEFLPSPLLSVLFNFVEVYYFIYLFLTSGLCVGRYFKLEEF